MKGFINVPSAGLTNATVDEVLAHAARSDAAVKIKVKSGSSTRLLQHLAEHATDSMLQAKWRDGEPILKTDLERDAEDKITALFAQLPDDRERRVALHKMRRWYNEKVAKEREEKASIDATIEWLRLAEETMLDIAKWGTSGTLMMERPQDTQSHKLADALRRNKMVVDCSQKAGQLSDQDAQHYATLIEEGSIYMVEHDWASAFVNAKEYGGGEIKLPDEACVFEFKISGRPLIATVLEVDGHLVMQYGVLSAKGTWALSGFARRYDDGRWGSELFSPDDHDDKLIKLVGGQVAAICIALDAEVAASEVVRAPHKLNRAREARGKLPIFDYHVVSLARRTRAPALPRSPDAEPGTKRRLHFRRGHWRHYENHKTWIKWMLVGDPDLGFVDKHYKL